MVEIHKQSKWNIIILIILGVAFIVIGVAALIPGAVFYTRLSEDPEDKSDFTLGITLLLTGGVIGITGIIFLMVLIDVVCCCLVFCPENLVKDPISYRTPNIV